jgi:hypothetical protein
MPNLARVHIFLYLGCINLLFIILWWVALLQKHSCGAMVEDSNPQNGGERFKSPQLQSKCSP